ncbi:MULTISPECIES: ABC transporter permease subunit [Streptomyces]|uniref:ABC transporter permease subunit n=1 Tax=Streptomyces thermoviolaceus subsp. thermoviolaceus TaxID=66860 RepID=A0ABX0Z147_STRTL|nr:MULTISPECIES: ABC transporter permease subunit [Streptomyces]MCM3263135.1 ABC transporter permease [Streptomyces thermoviolaceus]NJP17010.1 ABC transporter permease subunit [Streptomyces thermoviolaceus subsp. thermoviolaceus]RSS07084.1 ABC transporter permease [Streptomyces sp. WAC00469]WTD47393.1 ABC transporter permease [Streptomyces thermoviolaceus]GGV84084.1 ABC transporter [Streptomyces thermoviolaceus subsp. apingens]
MSTPDQPGPPPADGAVTPGPYAAYTSPIPVVRTHLGHAIAAEWTKLRSVRSTLWTLGVYVLLVVGTGLLIGLGVSASSTDLRGEENTLALGIVGVLVGSVCLVTLGALTTTSEYTTGLIRTTMTTCPSRVRVLLAKAVVFFLLAFTVTLVCSTLVGFLQTSLLSGSGAPRPTGDQWLKATVGVSLFLALLGLVSLLVGSMLRHAAAAITVMIGVVLAPLVLALFVTTQSLQWLRTGLLRYSVPFQLSVFYTGRLGDGGPTGWDPVWIMLGVAVVAFAGAWALLNRRDV